MVKGNGDKDLTLISIGENKDMVKKYTVKLKDKLS